MNAPRTLVVLLMAALLPVASAVRADTIAALETASGVAVQASLEGGDRLVISVLPTGDVLLNGRLGVSFDAQAGATAWGGDLPRLVLGDGDYFDGPVLETLRFAPDALDGSAAVLVGFGACLPVTGICVLEEALLTLTPGSNGVLDLTMASVDP